MNFDNEKKQCLEKQDKSRKGGIDEPIKKLVDALNTDERYYTTSSCSGRIVVQRIGSGRADTTWLLVKHGEVSVDEVLPVLKEVSGDVWFMMESLILHVACRSYEDALELVSLCRDAGLKRAGIQNKRNIVEIIGNERVEAIIAKNSELVVDENYLRLLIEEANKKIRVNFQRIDNLTSKVLS